MILVIAVVFVEITIHAQSSAQIQRPAQSLDAAMSPIQGGPIAVNPITDRIYAWQRDLPYVTVIDGTTNEETQIAIG
ncbi:MAG: hypothetical protein WA660_15175, partial [Candidatus Acidiferrales bacterium]